MPIQVQYRRGTAAAWTAANPVLAEGEPGWEKDTGNFKVGDGSTDWVSLPYSSGSAGPGYKATSATSFTIGTGSKAFTTQSGLAYQAGDLVKIACAADISQRMYGVVSSYSGVTLTVSVTAINGSGTYTSWLISLSAIQGEQGIQGASGGIPIIAAGGSADAITATFSPAITLADTQLCAFIATAANATPTPTFAPNGLTAHTITKKGGAALSVGDIPAAAACCILEYNLANTRWELLNPAVSGGFPTGGMLDWPTETVPSGYLERDGSSLDRTTYAALFAILGTVYGAADSSHFNLPDHRGRFRRSWAHGQTIDPGRATRTKVGAVGSTMTAGDHVGTEQAAEVIAHTHGAVGDHAHSIPPGTDEGSGYSGLSYGSTDVSSPGGTGAGGGHTHASVGGNETRPANYTVLPIIKY